MHTAVIAPNIYDGFERHGPSAILIEDRRIVGRVPQGEVPSHYSVERLPGGILVPGLIDLQVNGGGGVLLNNDPTAEGLAAVAGGHASAGVARVLATVISDRREVTAAFVEAGVTAAGDPDSGILGVHVEGPFFSPDRNGVHRRSSLRALDRADWDWIRRAATVPAILTLAPEQVDPDDIRKMVELGVRVSAGHTNATHAEVVRAIDAGLSGFTHLFNAMRPMSGREPGVVGTALSSPDTWCGIIADGIHVHLESLRLAFNAKPRGKMYLVSDAMATVGAREKSFELYGETIREVDGRLVNLEGRLAGSAISLTDAVRFCVTELKLPFDEAVTMASRYPAEYLRVDDRFGSLLPGRMADLTWFDDQLNVTGLWRAGHLLI